MSNKPMPSAALIPDDELPELIYDEPIGFELAGYWCWRGGGHVCVTACKSDSVPLFVQTGWAAHVRQAWMEEYDS